MDKSASRFLAMFALIWTAMVLSFDVFSLSSLIHQLQAQSFAATVGRITKSEVTCDTDSDGPTSGVDIQYDYRLGDQTFHGTRYRYGFRSSSDARWAYDAAQANPVGAEVRVFYNPRRPGQALLKPGIDGSDLFLMLFMTPFNAVMVCLWIWAATSLRTKGARIVAGGVRIISEGSLTRARLPRISPALAAVGTLGAVSFVSMFILASQAGYHPSLLAVSVTWLVVLATSSAAFLWLTARVMAGVEDLLIDDVTGTIILPRNFGRRFHLRLGVPEIKSVEVKKIVHPDSEGGDSNYTYAAMLRFDGQTPGEAKLAEWVSRDKAESFVAWLRERLRFTTPAALDRNIQ